MVVRDRLHINENVSFFHVQNICKRLKMGSREKRYENLLISVSA